MNRFAANAGLLAYIAASSSIAFIYPHSVLALLLFEISLLLLCTMPVDGKMKVAAG